MNAQISARILELVAGGMSAVDVLHQICDAEIADKLICEIRRTPRSKHPARVEQIARRANQAPPTAELLRKMLSYDAQSGVLTWVNPPLLSARMKGARAGGPHVIKNKNYRRMRIDGKQYSEHRVILAIVNGRWPEGVVDHVNGDGADNRLANLREATLSENARNAKMPATNSSGMKGVRRQPSGKYSACIRANKTPMWLGTFETAEQAHAAYVAAAKEHFGEFARIA